MGTPEPNPLDDEFARLLAVHDERLLTGEAPPREDVSPELAPRLAQAQAFVELLDGAWRHGTKITPPEREPTDDSTPLEDLPTAVGRFQIVPNWVAGAAASSIWPLMRRWDAK